jgi:hypothetical protein
MRLFVPDQPRFSRFALVLLTVGLLGLGAGCSQRANSRSLSPQAATGMNVATRDYNAILEIALRAWHTKDRFAEFSYTLDPDNPLISKRVRTAVAELFPVEPEALPENSFVIYIDEAAIPHANFAFLTMRTTNRYDATEYAIICQRFDAEWQIRDFFLVAAGLMQTSLHNFNWDGYESRLIRDGLIN